MAELEAVYEKDNIRDGWRYGLPVGKMLRLGNSPADADWTVSDAMVSKYHATLTWDGKALKVAERGPQPPLYPRAPTNPIWFNGQKVKECTLAPGDFFVIGETKFTLHGDHEQEPSNPVDQTVAQVVQDKTRAQLEELPFTNPAAALKAMEQVPNVLRAATHEQDLTRRMLKVVMDAIPRADAAAVVAIPPNCPPGELRIGTLDHQARAAAFGPQGFVPSRKLAHRAIRDRRSSLHVWGPQKAGEPAGGGGESADMTLAALHSSNVTPWAICTPFQDGSRSALYVAGTIPGQRAADDPHILKNLTEYQKVAELLVGLLETTRKTHKLTKQNALIKQSWPRTMWRYLDDPDQLEQLVKPRVAEEVTVLFCDLRGSSAFAERGKDDLLATWRGVASALDDMSGTITDREGIVAGFQGDATMGFWGWPQAQKDQLEKAAKGALRIQERFAGLVNTTELKCGLGLAHGRAVTGRLGANDLAKVDVYGPVVNLASRLENMTKAFGVSILVNEAVYSKLTELDPNAWRFRKFGRVQPKGMKDKFAVAELVVRGALFDDDFRLRMWDDAMDLFAEGKWDEAYARFENDFGDDSAAKCLTRTMDRTRRKPPPDWDGSYAPSFPD